MPHKVIWSSLNAAANELIETNLDKEEQEITEYEKEENERYGTNNIQMMPIKQLFSSPIGLISVSDALSPFKNYQLWQFDTTRRLTQEIGEKLRKLEGIEAFKIISPYKGIVAPGLAFDFRHIRPKIEAMLRDDIEILDSPTSIKVNKLKAELAQYSSFQILINPNGEIDFIYLLPDRSNLEQYNQTKELYKEARKLSNSLIVEKEENVG